VPFPGFLTAVRSRSGWPVGRGGECPTAHNRHPVVSRLLVWIRNRLSRPNPLPRHRSSPACGGMEKCAAFSPKQWRLCAIAGAAKRRRGWVEQQCTSNPAPRNTSPASEGYPPQDRSAPRPFTVVACGRRRVERRLGWWWPIMPFTATVAADRVSLRRPAVGMCAQANSPLTSAGSTE
jgi:hypothetical protein